MAVNVNERQHSPRARTVVLGARFTRAQAREIRALARAERMRPGDLVRLATLEYVRRRRMGEVQ
jgi:hypothetical protein